MNLMIRCYLYLEGVGVEIILLILMTMTPRAVLMYHFFSPHSLFVFKVSPSLSFPAKSQNGKITSKPGKEKRDSELNRLLILVPKASLRRA